MNESIQFIPVLSTASEFILLLLLNLAIGAIGFIPSFFITALNIDSLGLLLGSILTFTGEILGALIGFHLYRFGFSKIRPEWLNHSIFIKIKNSSPIHVFALIILLRIIPFVPSGIVTAGATFTSISGGRFMIASSIGKIPAVILEVAIVFGVLQKFPTNFLYGFLVLFILVSILFWIKKKMKTKS
ncbi:putative membrane protein YdjX (TVP38/TMEM64 family) [Psychrobacillus insolitus]|uniref:TVP38/TMEM64 family membrane protein n=1 Tax=Psychrobacillus insolitus TaxID=1461 RepID=A0A2W7MKQ6_9BACI|nr:VTT domain-containing protein [Psychrobacillus insolitus]PZX07310.1 putative membrane protein YdjX (TVP38/TMEM64 family) [Psychrobacillus insolitus]